MPSSGVFFEKKKKALAKRVLDFYEDVRYNYLSAKEDKKNYGKNWQRSVKKIRNDFDGLSKFSNEMKKWLREDIVFDEKVLDSESGQAQELWNQIKQFRFNSTELNDPFAKQMGDKVIETLVKNPSIYAMFIHYALRSHAHPIKATAWEAQNRKADEITAGAMGLDLAVDDIPLYLIEHYGDDVDTSRVKSKFKGAMEILQDVFLEEHSEEEWKDLIRIDMKKAEPSKKEKSEDEKAEVDFIVPNKPMYRIFEIEDINSLKGFTGEWVIQEKYDGIRIQIHKLDNKVKIYTYNEKDITDKCENIVDKCNAKKFGDMILDAELILYDGDEPLHRADTIAHLFKNKYKDAKLKAKVFDILHHEGKNLCDSTLRERVNILFYQLSPNSSDDCSFPSKKNTRIADSLKELKQYAESIMESKTSEGVVIKDIESTYYIGSKKNPKWIKWKKFVDLDLIVLDKSKTKSNLYSYVLGAGPLTGEESREYNGKEYDGLTYLEVGKALNTKESVDIGSIVRVKVDEVRKKGKGFSLYSAKVIEIPEVEAPEKIITLELLSKEGRKSLKYDVSEALSKYQITDGIHGTADIILKGDYEGFTVYGFSGDSLMEKNALADIDLWKEQIEEVVKSKSAEARIVIKDLLQKDENLESGLEIDDIMAHIKRVIPEITSALWDNDKVKLRNWMNDHDEFITLSKTRFQANVDKLVKVIEDSNPKSGKFKIYMRDDDNIDLVIEAADKKMAWTVDIEDSEDIYNLFGKSGKFPAMIASKVKQDKLLDKGEITLGVQRHGYHEYRLNGDKFDTRLHFRVIDVDDEKKWLVWTGIKQEMLEADDDEGIWDISQDRFKKLTL